MSEVFIFLAEGFEEVEALAPLDILRRAGISVQTVSVTGDLIVNGSHQIEVAADVLFGDIDIKQANMLVLPGGGAGTENLGKHKGLCSAIIDFNAENKYIAAICAAPVILSDLGIIASKVAVCYPSMESRMNCLRISDENVVVDGNIITSKAMGTAIDFGLKLAEVLLDKAAADKVRDAIYY